MTNKNSWRAASFSLVNWMLLCLAAFCFPINSHAEAIKINTSAIPSNCFGGRRVSAGIIVASGSDFNGILTWDVSCSQRILQRSEKALVLSASGQSEIFIEISLPPVKDDIAISVDFNISILSDADRKKAAGTSKRIWIFADNPFHSQKAVIRAMNIYLFDPLGETKRRFVEMDLAFKTLHRIENLDRITGSVIIVGEGNALNEYRGTAAALRSCMQTGNTVLLLSPRQWHFNLPEIIGDHRNLARQLKMSDGSIIAQIDKRLDAQQWHTESESCGKVHGMEIKALLNKIVGQVSTDKGWPWIDLQYAHTSARMVYCGFSILENWDEAPSARYLLRGILDDLYGNMKPTGR